MTESADAWKGYKEAILERIDFQDLFVDLKQARSSGDGWISALCPFHADTSPSFGFNPQTGQWCCHAGCGKGSAFDFLMHTSGKDFKSTLIELGDRLGVPRPSSADSTRPPIDEGLINQWATYLRETETAGRCLREQRGLTQDTIRRYQIGWDPKRQRYTIPVRDERGKVVNIRLYSTSEKPKIINYTDAKHKYGSPARLYGLKEMANDTGDQVVLCEGEWDRLILQQEGFMAVTGTHGATTFRPEWASLFKDKDVVIIYDCDTEGRAAVQNIVLKALKESEARSIKNVILPLSGEKNDKDVTDFFMKGGHTATDLQKIIDDTPVHSFKIEEEPEDVFDLQSFTEIERADLIDKKVRCDITVCGETSEAFHAAEEFKISHCGKMEAGTCFECGGRGEPIRIPRSSQEYIGSCMSPNTHVTAMLREYACKYGQRCKIEVLKCTTVKEFFCHQKTCRISQTHDENGNVVQTIDGKMQELMEKKVYFLSSNHPKPGNYRATGWVKSHPKTQQVTFLIDTLEPLEDDYESFRIEENLDSLRGFRSLSWPDKIKEMSENVTRVYNRDEILVAILLTYCSPRWIPFNGEIIRGWLITVVIGDSGSGKTQTHQRIAEFAKIGDCFSGLTGSRTGLAYALVDHKQKGWHVRIGRYPANSRRILTVDEAQYLPEEDLRTISKGMDEGFLQIDRVQSKGYESQTRLIMIANPKRDQIMDEFAFGCQSLKTIFPPTIIRRTDIAVFANSGDLSDLSVINRRHSSVETGRVTPEMLRAIIYWAWNLKPEQIIFTSQAEAECLEQAQGLAEVYHHAVDVPLVALSDIRKKLARLAAAFAVLDVSGDEHFTRLVIEPQHVRAAKKFLHGLYSHDNCALNDYSQICRMGSELYDYEEIEAEFLRRRDGERHAGENGSGNLAKIIFTLHTTKAIRREDLAEQANCSVDTVKRIIQVLKRFTLLDSTRDGYVKKPKFNKFLRRFLKAHPDFFEEVRGASLTLTGTED